jgi:hypothetical protein
VGNPIPTSQPCSSHLHYHRLLLKHNDWKTPCHRPMFVLHRFHIGLLNMRTTFDRCTCIGIHAPKRHCRPCPAHPCMHALLPKTEDTLIHIVTMLTTTTQTPVLSSHQIHLLAPPFPHSKSPFHPPLHHCSGLARHFLLRPLASLVPVRQVSVQPS